MKKRRSGLNAVKQSPFEPLPTSVEVGGVSYKINSDFRFFVALEQAVYLGEPIDTGSLLRDFYTNDIPVNVEEAAEKMLWFFRGYTDENAPQAQGGKKNRQYDYEQDADVLAASFLDSYGIDLYKDSLHWWTFRRLMLSLPDSSPFMERVRYRVIDISKVEKKLQPFYRRMRNLHAIRSRKGEEAKTTVEKRDEALREKMRKRYEEAQKAVASDNKP